MASWTSRRYFWEGNPNDDNYEEADEYKKDDKWDNSAESGKSLISLLTLFDRPADKDNCCKEGEDSQTG